MLKRPTLSGLLIAAALLLAANFAPLRVTKALPFPVTFRDWAARAEAGRARVSPEPAGHSVVVAEGRVTAYPGYEVTLSTETGGTVAELPVSEMGVVQKGDLVAQLHSDEQRAALLEAESKAVEIEAEVKLAEWKLERVRQLVPSGAASDAELRECKRNLDAAHARRNVAAAAMRRHESVLYKLTFFAPIDGVVTSRPADVGELLTPGQTLLTVADLGRLRIEAEVDEFDAGRVELGDEVEVSTDGRPGVAWRGRVEEVPDVVVPKRFRPQDPSRPTDARVLLVKVAMEEAAALKLGQRVEVRINTGK